MDLALDSQQFVNTCGSINSTNGSELMFVSETILLCAIFGRMYHNSQLLEISEGLGTSWDAFKAFPGGGTYGP